MNSTSLHSRFARCSHRLAQVVLLALLFDRRSGAAQTILSVSTMFPGNGDNTYYGLSSAEVVVTNDGGVTWNPIFIYPPGVSQGVSALAVDPNNKAVLYAGVPLAKGGVMRTSEGGATWVAAGTGLPSGAGSIGSLQILSSDSRVLYARIGNLVFKTADGGGSWRRQSTLPAQTGLLDINMANPRRWMFAAGLTISLSSDEGATWRTATLNLGTGGAVGADAVRSVSALASSPHDPNLVFAAITDNIVNAAANLFGIYRSSDGGSTFTRTDGLKAFINSAAAVRSILIDPRTSTSVLDLLSGGDRYDCRSDDNYSSAAKCSQTGAFKFDPSGLLKLAPRAVAADPQISGMLYGFDSGGFCQSKDFGSTWSCTKGDLTPTLSQPASPIQFRLTEGSQSTVSWAATLVESGFAKLPFTLTMPDDPWLTLNPCKATRMKPRFR